MKASCIVLLLALVSLSACDSSYQGAENAAPQSENTTQSISPPKPLSKKEKQFAELKKKLFDAHPNLNEQARKKIEDAALIPNLSHKFYVKEDWILRPWDIKQMFQSKKFKIQQEIKKNVALVEKYREIHNVPIVTLFSIKAIEDHLHFQDENNTIDALVTMSSYYNGGLEQLLLSAIELSDKKILI